LGCIFLFPSQYQFGHLGLGVALFAGDQGKEIRGYERLLSRPVIVPSKQDHGTDFDL
jgi:hypothetical protein